LKSFPVVLYHRTSRIFIANRYTAEGISVFPSWLELTAKENHFNFITGLKRQAQETQLAFF
jgi:hypothetical protein